MVETTPAILKHDRRHGAAYVLVLCTGFLLTVVGLGVIASSRSTTRAISANSHLLEATLLAENGVEWGLSAIKNDANWRTTYTNNVASPSITVGNGRYAFKLVDETDGVLSNSTSDAVRIYGMGWRGSAMRAFSVKAVGTGASLDSLKNSVQAGGNLNVTSAITTTGGPISANGTLSVGSGITVNGDVEGKTLNISGSVSGARTTLTSTRSLPSTTAFDTYKSQAMTIPFTSISGGTINGRVISGGSNPWGSPNASGVYYIKVPSTGTLTIKSSRLLATLVVEVESGGVFTMSGAVNWNPPRTDYPTLIVKGSSSSSVLLTGTTGSLSEGSTLANYNPSSTPNASGVSDNDYSDTYPSEVNGLVHVVGASTSVSLNTNFVLKGSLIAEGTVSLGSGVKLTASPTLAATPPLGYSAVSQMIISPGTWRWEPGW